YQTSGNIAVFDDDALRYADFARAFAHKFGIAKEQFDALHKEITSHLTDNPGNGNTSPEVLSVKGLIRQGEATAACRYSGVKEENIHFMNLPFYETGHVEKNPLSSADVDIVVAMLRRIQPHQIFAAGDLQDPHGT